MRRLAEFRAHPEHIARRLYPSAHPSRPDDAWSFATFGQTVNAVVAHGTYEREALHRLLHLRNAVAHCHYVSWAAVEELLSLQRRLAA